MLEVVKRMRTALYKMHVKAGAQCVDFAGWEMPLHYGSQIAEHHIVRKAAGIFDVSHMGVIDIVGEDANYFLRYLLANDIQKLKAPGSALYSCMLNDNGGVIDDLIVYWLTPHQYRLVVNAGTREKDLSWIEHHSQWFDVVIHPRPDLGIIAVQGPQTLAIAAQVFPKNMVSALSALKPFQFMIQDTMQLARTGYTGEDGLEIIAPSDQIPALWKEWVAKGAMPCGLGARDTLRLEAGLNLYGADMDDHTSPLSSNLAWTVSWQDPDRDFIGKNALKEQLSKGIKDQLVGLLMEGAGVLRDHEKVYLENGQEGVITSGSFSPTLGRGIALARIPVGENMSARVERRGKFINVTIVKPPFIGRQKKT